MDYCRKNLAERIEEEVLDNHQVEERKRWRCTFGMEEGTQEQEIQNKEVVGRLLGKNFRFV